MRWRDAAGLLVASAAGFQEASAKLITITEYPSSCKATYTSGSRSVTIVQSTVIVSPAPWTDGDANNGKPFVLEVQTSSGGYRKRAAGVPVFVRSDGEETTNMEDAAQYLIKEGKLTSIDGGFISADENTQNEPFALSSMLEAISTTFRVDQGVLSWANPDFNDGAAQFYSTRKQPQVIVRFKGSIDPSWEPVVLAARPANEGSQGGSETLTPYPPAGSTGASQGGGSAHGYSSHTRSLTGYPNQSSASGGPSGSPTASGNVSPSGLCGGDSGYTCIGSGFGDCCSRHGRCGTGKRYCENGCQPLFGICWSLSSTAGEMGSGVSAMSSVAGGSWPGTIPISLISRTPSTTIPGSSSTVFPMSTFSIPAGPIGPINPLSPNVSISTTWSTTEINSSGPTLSTVMMSSSFMASHSGAMSSSTPVVAPCPTSAASLCGSPSNSATCSSSGGTVYNNSCGIEYQGTVIDTSNIVGLPPPRKRAIENSFADCQTLCDRYPSCIALNYIGTNCTLLSTVTGTSQVPGAVGAVVPPEYVPAKTNPASSSMPKSTVGNSIAATSNSGMIRSSSSPAMVMPSSIPPVMVSSSTSRMVMPSSSTAMATSSSSSSVMVLSTISEISTSTTSPRTVVSTSSPALSSSSPVVASSSNQLFPTSSHSSAMVSPNPATSSSASPSPSPSFSPSPNPICPSANGTGYFDPQGNQYIVLCNIDFTPGAVDVSQKLDLGSCIDSCAGMMTHHCVGVTFVPGATEIDTGACYYHQEYSSDSPNPNVNAAVLASLLGVTPAAYTPSLSSASIPASSSASFSTTLAMSSSAISSSVASSIASSTAVSSSPAITSSSSPSSTAQSSSSSASSSSTNTNYLVLPSPTPCDFGDGPDWDEDDSYCEIQLPFQMQIYSQGDRNTFASTNGYISIQHGSSQYSNQQFPASNIPSNAVAPFFDDLYLVGNSTPQTGIFYQVSRTAVTYEYYLNRGENTGIVDTSETFHFTVQYDSAQPGVFTYTYYQTGGSGDNGKYAAVGMQGIGSAGTEQGFTYSFQSADITPGLVVTCNTQANTCVTVQR